MKWIKASEKKPSIELPLGTGLTGKYKGIGIGLVLLKNEHHGVGWHTWLHTNGYSNHPELLGARTFILSETWNNIEWLDEETEGWISVDDELPEFDIKVLTLWFCDSKVNGKGFWIYEIGSLLSTTTKKGSSGIKRYSDWHTEDNWNNSNVTHWQPLPQPPKL